MVWKLLSIQNSGRATLARLSPIGEVISTKMQVEAAALINDYKVFDKKFTLLRGYPGNEARHNDKLHKHIADSRVLDCLRTLAMLPRYARAVEPAQGALC